MKNSEVLRFLFLGLICSALSASLAGQCAGEAEEYRRSTVTYLSFDRPAAVFDSQCSLFTRADGTTVCRVRLRGTLYLPLQPAYTPPPGTPPPTFPALVVNHGSGKDFVPDRMFCEIANYFVPRGYIVFVPFRRGQGGSSGVYIDDMVSDYVNGGGQYAHSTSCPTNGGPCYRAQLFTEQADEDVAAAIDYLKSRSDVKRQLVFDDGAITTKYGIGIMGNSYGGAVTVLTNRIRRGQEAAICFSPGAQQFAPETCQPTDTSCQTPVQTALMEAARIAKKPAYYLQAKWDFDTRPTIDLAYAHAYGSPDPMHSKGWMASIFPYQNPCTELTCDYQSIHEGFIRDPGVWGASVLNFLKRNGVK